MNSVSQHNAESVERVQLIIRTRMEFLMCTEKVSCEVSQSICEIVDLTSPNFSLLLGPYTGCCPAIADAGQRSNNCTGFGCTVTR